MPKPSAARPQARKGKIDDQRKVIRIQLALLIALFMACVVVIVRNAWLNDDAFITFRTIDNFLEGYGLRWNIVERVQTYTHPLWMIIMVLVGGVTNNLPVTAITLSFFFSLTAIGLISFSLSADRLMGALLILSIVLSKTLIDFTSSGLENPLSFLLAVLFVLAYIKFPASPARMLCLCMIASLATLTRMDHLLLYLPSLVYVWRAERPSRSWVSVLAGSAPLFIWFSFSFLYYGFLFPNTAYAKLNTGISDLSYAKQGISYLWYSSLSDPLAPFLFCAAILLPILMKKKRLIPLTLGVLIYLLYTVKVGGDFMVGRFLSVPLFLSLCILSQIPLKQKFTLYGFAAVLIIGMLVSHPPLTSGQDYGKGEGYWTDINQHEGICDERAFYYPQFGLLNGTDNYKGLQRLHRTIPSVDSTGRKVVRVDGRIGITSYLATSQTHIIDLYALTDALLARLPTKDTVNWRVGHFTRDIPNGYRESLTYDTNVVTHPALAEYYQRLTLITRAPIFDPARLRESVRFAMGRNDSLIAAYLEAEK